MGEIILVEELPTGGFCPLCVTWGDTIPNGTAPPHVACPKCGRICTGFGDAVLGQTHGDAGRKPAEHIDLQLPSRWLGRPDGAPNMQGRRFLPSPMAQPMAPPAPPRQSRQQKRAEQRKAGRNVPRRM